MSMQDKQIGYADLPVEPQIIEVKNGRIKYYDKDAKTDMDVDVDPFKFVLLEECIRLKQWDDTNNVFASSNFIQKANMSSQLLLVREYINNKRVEIARGFYSDIKDKVVGALGATGYTVVLFAAAKISKEQDEMKIYRIELPGSSRGAWMDQIDNPYGRIITIRDWEDKTKGATSYRIPVFELEMLTEAQEERFRTVECRQLMNALQPFIEQQQAHLRSGENQYTRQQITAAFALDRPNEQTAPKQPLGNDPAKWDVDDDIPFGDEASPTEGDAVEQAVIEADTSDPF